VKKDFDHADTDGEIVVALADNEVTVKRLFHEGNHVRLQPANERYSALRLPDVQVLGVVVGTFKAFGRKPKR